MNCLWRSIRRTKRRICPHMKIYVEKNITSKYFRMMEMNQETLEKMRQMRLSRMYYAFKTSMDSFKAEYMTTDQFVSCLVANEWDDWCS